MCKNLLLVFFIVLIFTSQDDTVDAEIIAVAVSTLGRCRFSRKTESGEGLAEILVTVGELEVFPQQYLLDLLTIVFNNLGGGFVGITTRSGVADVIHGSTELVHQCVTGNCVAAGHVEVGYHDGIDIVFTAHDFAFAILAVCAHNPKLDFGITTAG